MEEQSTKTRINTLVKEALRELSILPKPVIQFCAPISTGGFGDVEVNKENLISFILHFEKKINYFCI